MSIAAACPTVDEQTPPSEQASHLGRWIQKAYWHGLEYCLSELPWVPKTTLDAGCGDGTFLAALGSFYRWSSLDAVEFNADLLGKAQVCHPCRVQYKQLAPTEDFPYPDNHFDLVVSHVALNYCTHPDLWLAEMKRVSADVVLVSTIMPNAMPFLRKINPRHWQINGRGKQIELYPAGMVKAYFKGEDYRLLSHCAPFPYQIQLFQRDTSDESLL